MELIEGKDNFGDVEGEFVVYIYDSLIFLFIVLKIIINFIQTM